MTKAERAKQHQREVVVSRSKLILIVVCLIAIPVTFWINHSDVGSIDKRVTKVESPCLRYGPKSDQCKEAFEAAVATITHPEACAIERKAGTLRAIRELAQGLGVDFKEPCAGARLAQERQRGNERDATTRLNNGSEGGGGPMPVSGDAPAGDGGSVGDGKNQGGSPAQHSPSPHPAPQPPEGGGGSTPVDTDPVAPAGPPADNSGGEQTDPGSTHPESVLESAGSTVGDVVHGTGEVLEATTCGLTAPLLCPKP